MGRRAQLVHRTPRFLDLRRALDREWGNDGSEVTAERPYSTTPPPLPTTPTPVRPGDLVALHALDAMPTAEDLIEDLGEVDELQGVRSHDDID